MYASLAMPTVASMWTENAKVADIAIAVGVSKPTVYKLLHRAGLLQAKPMKKRLASVPSPSPRLMQQKQRREAIAYVKDCARRRGVSTNKLRWMIIDAVLRDRLVDAVLDDNGSAAVGEPAAVGFPSSHTSSEERETCRS
jgi:hypothetical protein